MSNPFTITTVFERNLSEFNAFRDEATQGLHPSMIFDSPNFHWFELKMKNEITRIEAIRDQTEPDRNHQWKWPDRFRVIYEKKGERTEQVIERGYRGAEIGKIEICGMKLYQFSPTKIMARKSFISLSFKVGRQVKTIETQKEKDY